MNGVIYRKNKSDLIIEIKELSNEFKEKIKNEIKIICHGEFALSSKSIYYTFSETITELNFRLNKDKKRKIGMIGELLLNIIIRIFTGLRIISPFFNLEERNLKKGFDIIAIDEKKEIWLIESKAGQIEENKNITSKALERLKQGKKDLKKRLNKKNTQLWLNAIKSVNASLDNNSEKKTIINILEETSNTITSENKNIVLGGVVFCLSNSIIEDEKIEEYKKKLVELRIFSKIKLIIIHKKTYEKILDYLLTIQGRE